MEYKKAKKVPIDAPIKPSLGINIKFIITLHPTTIEINFVCCPGRFAIRSILLKGM